LEVEARRPPRFRQLVLSPISFAAAGSLSRNELAHAKRSRPVVIVAGALIVDPDGRDAYLEGCVSVVQAARRAQGCLDFALSPDLLERGRINVYERWRSNEDLHRFRGSGPDGGQLAELLDIQVREYAVLERPG
jgi:quinol monooxygenase YgiN